MGLTGFLTARLDEDEAAARSASAADGVSASWEELPGGGVLECGDGTSSDPWEYTWSVGDQRVSSFIARHDPARALREVAAKRERLAAYVAAKASMPHDDDIGYEFGPGVRAGAADALDVEVRRDAAIYSDHPDYDPELPA